MAEPKIRFRRDDGSNYPEWKQIKIGNIYQKVNEKNDLSFTADKIISVANMFFRGSDDRNSLDDDYMKTYNVMRLGDIAFEGHENKEHKYGRFIANTIGDGIVSHIFVVLRPVDEHHNKEYWKIVINNERVLGPILRQSTKKSTMMHDLVIEDFINKTISVPCLEEQQKIADFLSSVDEVIAASEQEVANLETQKKTVMKKIFSQEVRFKREDGSDFPEWEEKTIDDLCNLVTKQTGFDYSATIKPALLTSNKDAYPYLQTKNFSERSFNYQTDYYMPYSIAQQFPKLILDEPLLLFSIVGASVGNIAFFPGMVKCFLSGAICVAKFKCIDDIAFTYYYMLSDMGQKQIKTVTKGGAQATITIEDIRKFVIMMPCDEERIAITEFLSDFDEAIAAAKKELELWKELKKGLLQQMFV